MVINTNEKVVNIITNKNIVNKTRIKNFFIIKKYYKENKENINQHHKEYYENNKNTTMQYTIEYNKNRRNINPIFRLINNNRSRIYQALKSNSKTTNTIDLLGCSKKFF